MFIDNGRQRVMKLSKLSKWDYKPPSEENNKLPSVWLPRKLKKRKEKNAREKRVIEAVNKPRGRGTDKQYLSEIQDDVAFNRFCIYSMALRNAKRWLNKAGPK